MSSSQSDSRFLKPTCCRAILYFLRQMPRPSHVAIYVGNGLIVQALNESTGVIVSHLSDSYYADRFIGARRLW